MTKKGWFRESARHSLAAKGVRTARKIRRSIPLKMKTLKEAEEEEQMRREYAMMGEEHWDEDRNDLSNPDSDASIDAEAREEMRINGLFEYEDDVFHEFLEDDVNFRDWLKTRRPEEQKYFAKDEEEFEERKKNWDMDYQRTHPPIQTIQGPAHYVKTELEDKNGRWNDNYYTRDGYWVVHKGNHHHVYKVR